MMTQMTLSMRTLKTNLIFENLHMLLCMYSLLYVFLRNFYYPPLPLIAAGLVSGAHGTTCQN